MRGTLPILQPSRHTVFDRGLVEVGILPANTLPHHRLTRRIEIERDAKALGDHGRLIVPVGHGRILVGSDGNAKNLPFPGLAVTLFGIAAFEVV